MEEIFQVSTHFKPSPPSDLGKQISPHATLALAKSQSLPFHKNLLNFWEIFFRTLLGRIKILVQ
jgi:hypothetical protein